MPQKFAVPAYLEFNGLSELPAHAAALGRLVSASAKMEASLSLMLAMISGSSAPVAVTMLSKVQNTAMKKQLLEEVAKLMLEDGYNSRVRYVISRWDSMSRQRNKLVHGLWGTSDQHPGMAVYCSIKSISDICGHLGVIMSSRTLTDKQLLSVMSLWKHCELYSVEDIDESHNNLVNFTRKIDEFNNDFMKSRSSLP